MYCFRERETTATHFLGVRISLTEGETRTNAFSDAYDQTIEDPESPHSHQWIMAQRQVRRSGGLGPERLEHQHSAEPFRTQCALQMVLDCRQSVGDEEIRKRYRLILADYENRDAKTPLRLAELSQAASEARDTADPASYWNNWWKAHRKDYDRNRGRAAPPKPYVPRATIHLGPTPSRGPQPASPGREADADPSR